MMPLLWFGVRLTDCRPVGLVVTLATGSDNPSNVIHSRRTGVRMLWMTRRVGVSDFAGAGGHPSPSPKGSAGPILDNEESPKFGTRVG